MLGAPMTILPGFHEYFTTFKCFFMASLLKVSAIDLKIVRRLKYL